MEFNAKKETEKVIEFIKNYYSTNNLGGAVVGVSGGKDSAVVLALFAKALGSENVVGVTLPCHSETQDEDLAKLVASHYGVKLYNLDLTDVFDSFVDEFEFGYKKLDAETLKNSNINLKPRLRMASLYYYAAMLTSVTGKGYLVAGTGNKCEQYVGYFTKGGDGVCDISVLADFTVDEVIAIGEELGVPSKVLYRAPSDGLSGQTDEEKLGVTYKQIADAIEGKDTLPKDIAEKISKLHNSSKHKFYVPTYRR